MESPNLTSDPENDLSSRAVNATASFVPICCDEPRMLLSKVVTWVVSASRTASQARAAELATSIQQESQVDVVAVVPVDVVAVVPVDVVAVVPVDVVAVVPVDVVAVVPVDVAVDVVADEDDDP